MLFLTSHLGENIITMIKKKQKILKKVKNNFLTNLKNSMV